MTLSMLRTKWAAIGAAIAVTLGAGGWGLVDATTSSGERPVYLPIQPCRLADTRPAPFTVGPRTGSLGPAETSVLSGWGTVGNCTLPNGTAGLALNVTAVDPTAPTFLTLFPADKALPNSSNLNPWPGQPPTPNAVSVDLSPAGEFKVYNLAGNVHLIVDVVGIYDDHQHDDRYYTEAEADARTTVASDSRSANLVLTTANQVALSTTIDTGAGMTLIVSASVEVTADGGSNDNINCNIDVDGTNGVRLSTDVNDGLTNVITLPLTQVLPVTAGTHTVIVECAEGVTSNSTLQDRALSVLAVG